MSARGDRKLQARKAREAAERDAARAVARRRRTLLVGAVVVGLLAVGAPIALLTGSGGPRAGESTITAGTIPPQRVTDLDAAVRLAGAKRISHSYAFGVNDHTDDRVAYPTNPTTNGPHAFTWTADGSYAGLAAPPTGQVVHAQEHGRVVIQYRAGLPRQTMRQLQALYDESPNHVLLLENATDMPCDVAATAWGQGLLCPRVTPRTFDAVRAFRDTFRDKGPETVA